MDAKKGNQLAKMLVAGFLVVGAFVFINHFKVSQSFPIKSVRVYGANRIEHQEIEKTLLPLVNRGFFNINVEYIRDRLVQMPWVSDVSVRRHWPDQVEITVVERNAIAKWNEGDLLSDAGVVFAPEMTTYPANLPLIIGPDGKQMFVLQYFMEINRLLQPIHAKIASLELTPYLSWKLTLDNGMKMQIGHKDILTRLDHFVKVYPKIVGDRAAEIDYIDLRYSNGAAIRWKKPVTT